MILYTVDAGVVEQADTRDLKSLALKSVPVRSRSPAPTPSHFGNKMVGGCFFIWKIGHILANMECVRKNTQKEVIL